MTTTTPHDGSYKHLFSHPEMVESLLRAFVPEGWVREIDFSSLMKMPQSFVTDDLRERHDDIIWRVKVRRKWCYVYLLFEFQSEVDVWMAVRIMVYEGLLYQDLIKSGEIRPGDPLPPVFPLVLYNGEGRWTARQDVAELIAPMPTGLERYRPSLRYYLLDEGRVSGEDLAKAEGLCAILIRLERASNLGEAAAILRELKDQVQHPRYTSLRRAFTIWVRRVLLRRIVPDEDIPEVNELEEVNAMLAERVTQWTKGWKMEGRIEGQADVLLRLMSKRFRNIQGTDIQERLRGASPEQIEIWTDRILDARTIDEVFAEKNGCGEFCPPPARLNDLAHG